MNKIKLTSNMEDYLEMIGFILKEKGVVRVKDISARMHVRNASVTGALASLARSGMVVHEKYGYVDLTKEGKKISDTILKRHELLKNFLVNVLGLDANIAETDACQMEHAMSSETIEKLALWLDKEDKL